MLRRLSVVQFNSQIELVIYELVSLERAIWIKDHRHSLRILVQLLNIDLCAELNDMSERHSLFSVSDEKSFCHKRCILIKYLRLEKAVKVCSCVISLQIASALKMVRVCIINLFFILIEDLKLEEVDSLLEQVHITEVLNMKHELGPSSIHYLL